MVDLEALKEAIIEGEEEKAVEMTRRALGEGASPQEVFDRALIPGMSEVGRRMQVGEYFIPEVLFSARTMQACAEILRPIIVKTGGVKPLGVAVACSVKGDLHDIGKNLVCMMLEGAGFKIVDLGKDCSAEQIAAAAKEHDADLVLLSAMLTTTMLNMGEVITTLTQRGLRDQVRVMVGGAPVDARFAQKIGADAYCNDAASAAITAKNFMTFGIKAV